jgi:hypothetical protein
MNPDEIETAYLEAAAKALHDEGMANDLRSSNMAMARVNAKACAAAINAFSDAMAKAMRGELGP